MGEICFSYSGATIQAPLKKLLFELIGEAAVIQADVAKAKKHAIETAPPSLGHLAAPPPEWREKERFLIRLHHDILDARLWALEAKRTPKKVWTLDVSQLRWLFRYMAHSDILQSLTAKGGK